MKIFQDHTWGGFTVYKFQLCLQRPHEIRVPGLIIHSESRFQPPRLFESGENNRLFHGKKMESNRKVIVDCVSIENTGNRTIEVFFHYHRRGGGLFMIFNCFFNTALEPHNKSPQLSHLNSWIKEDHSWSFELIRILNTNTIDPIVDAKSKTFSMRTMYYLRLWTVSP